MTTLSHTVNTLLPCLYVGATVYACCHAFSGIITSGIFFSCVLFGCLALILSYFKIQPAPLENCKVVFGDQPEDFKLVSCNESTGISSTRVLRCANKLYENSAPKKPQDGTVEENCSVKSIRTTVIGHRGAGLDAPENSVSAFRLCKKRGCDFVELDVALTKDKVLVVFHDDDLSRMAGLQSKVNEMTLEELQLVNISVYHPLKDKFPEEKIPTFIEIVQLLLDLKMRFFIDLKDTDSQVVTAVCDAFTSNPEMYQRAVVTSFFAKIIHDIRRRDPKIIGCMAWRPSALQYKQWSADGQNMELRYPLFFQNWLASAWDGVHDWVMWRFHWWFLGLSAVLLHKDAVSKYDLRIWHQRSVRVFVWTVNTPLEKLFFTENIGVGYLTDTLHGEFS